MKKEVKAVVLKHHTSPEITKECWGYIINQKCKEEIDGDICAEFSDSCKLLRHICVSIIYHFNLCVSHHDYRKEWFGESLMNECEKCF